MNGRKPMNSEYGPGNMYTVASAPQYYPLNWWENPMPPRDMSLYGAGMSGFLGGTMGAGLGGATGPGALATGAVGAGAMMAGEYLADRAVRQPARDAYNNEYSPMQRIPNALTPRF
jgi:hypothetical protein